MAKKISKDMLLGGLGKVLKSGKDKSSPMSMPSAITVSKNDFPALKDIKEGDVINLTASVDKIIGNDISLTVIDASSSTHLSPAIPEAPVGSAPGSKLADRLGMDNPAA